MKRERALAVVPLPVWALLGVGLALQLLWQALQPPLVARAEALPPAPGLTELRLLSLGDLPPAAKVAMLWLQAFDNQPGISIPFTGLDYGRVEGWLERILDLDPRSQYPLLAASRLYAEVPDEARQRRMLEFVYRQFHLDPNKRWRWMAHGALLAKHRLKDLPLALKYARAITNKATGPHVPYWARDMTILVLEDMGELEAAQILIGGLMDGGEISDPNELKFLEDKLFELKKRSDKISTPR